MGNLFWQFKGELKIVFGDSVSPALHGAYLWQRIECGVAFDDIKNARVVRKGIPRWREILTTPTWEGPCWQTDTIVKLCSCMRAQGTSVNSVKLLDFLTLSVVTLEDKSPFTRNYSYCVFAQNT